jgi:hypothetical protein
MPASTVNTATAKRTFGPPTGERAGEETTSIRKLAEGASGQRNNLHSGAGANETANRADVMQTEALDMHGVILARTSSPSGAGLAPFSYRR